MEHTIVMCENCFGMKIEAKVMSVTEFCLFFHYSSQENLFLLLFFRPCKQVNS